MVNPNLSKDWNIETFGEYYSKPSWWFRWRYDTQVKRKTLLALIKSQQKDLSESVIFELGFGSGDVLFSFPHSCEIYGMELSPSAVKRALLIAKRKDYKKYDFFKTMNHSIIPLKDNSVTLAIAAHVLEHVEDDRAYLLELYRIMQPRAKLAILIPINELFTDPNHRRKYTSDGLKRLCENFGFRYVYGFENELLSHYVSGLYMKYQGNRWPLWPNILRITFNLLTAPLPYPLYSLTETIIKSLTSLPPRQAALLFIKQS